MKQYTLVVTGDSDHIVTLFDDLDLAIDCYKIELDKADLSSVEVNLYSDEFKNNKLTHLKIA